MTEVFIVTDDSGYDNEIEIVGVRSTEEKAEALVQAKIREKIEEEGPVQGGSGKRKKYGWKEAGRVPGQSARWESTNGEWIAWEKHKVD